jgi:hypothetical protein
MDRELNTLISSGDESMIGNIGAHFIATTCRLTAFLCWFTLAVTCATIGALIFAWIVFLKLWACDQTLISKDRTLTLIIE